MQTRRPLLLIVEAHDTLSRQYAEFTGAAGFHVEHAPDNDQALAKATFLNPDVVLTDCSAESSGAGVDFCRRLKGRSSTSGIPVLGLISSDPTEAGAAAAVGCTVLLKPCSPERLLAEIVRVLDVLPRGRTDASQSDDTPVVERLEQVLDHLLRENAELVRRNADLEASALLWADWYEGALERAKQVAIDARTPRPPVASPAPIDDAVQCEARWQAWVARGAAHDAKLRVELKRIGVALALLLLGWLSLPPSAP